MQKNITPDYALMLLKAERDCIEIDSRSARRKLSDAKALVNRLAFLDAPTGDKIHANRRVTMLENIVEYHASALEAIRARVSRDEAALSGWKRPE